MLAVRPGASFSTSLCLGAFSDHVDKGEENGTCQRGRINDLINPFKALSVSPACSQRPSTDSRYFCCWLGAERLKGHWWFIPEPGQGARCQNRFESIVTQRIVTQELWLLPCTHKHQTILAVGHTEMSHFPRNIEGSWSVKTGSLVLAFLIESHANHLLRERHLKLPETPDLLTCSFCLWLPESSG